VNYEDFKGGVANGYFNLSGIPWFAPKLPIYLRNFYIKKLVDTKKEEQKQIEKSQSKIKKPNFRK